MAATSETAEQECVDGPFYLESLSIPGDAEDDDQFEEVLPDEERSLAEEGEEDFEAALRAMRQAAQEARKDAAQTRRSDAADSARQHVSHIPEVVDDFLRNFLVGAGMSRTLASFETEWYEVTRRGALEKDEPVVFVPDAHTRNRLLRDELSDALRERDAFKQAALRAGEARVTVQRERDFRRVQHARVAQEKDALARDIQRLTSLLARCEPELKHVTDKHRDTLRQKMLASLERDRAHGQSLERDRARGQSLERDRARGQSLERDRARGQSLERDRARGQSLERDRARGQSLERDRARGQSLERDRARGRAQSLEDTTRNVHSSSVKSVKHHPCDSEFPLVSRVNPSHLARVRSLAPLQGTNKSLGSWALASSLNAHPLPVSCLALHPRKLLVASASDDHLWRLWAVPGEDKAWEMIMTGEGHTDWLSDVSFHPSGGSLATTSGDTTVKLWDFSQGRCVLTLTGHSHATWGCSFHPCGDFVASCSMDHTAKVWDLRSARCRHTLRGHADSVNAVAFLPGSAPNALLTCSADKTLALWDVRAGTCAQTLCGHRHSCNHVACSPLGDYAVASCDSFGVVKLWDVRKMAAVVTVDTGPHAGNRVAFSPSGRMLAVASDDCTVKLLELASSQVSCLSGHTDSVQSVVFDHTGEYLLSAGSDGVIIAWS